MTTDELVDYYAGLLILQYAEKDRAVATIKAVARMAIVDQLPLLISPAFALDTAVGVQLDIIGKYVGVSRINVTFTDQIVLSDDDFRLLIKMKIVQNNSGSSLADIQSLVHTYFNGTLLVFDNQSMQMSFFFNSTGSADLAEVFVRNGFLPKPMGVQLGSLIYIPTLSNSFTFRSYELPAVDRFGFNTYEDYQSGKPWLTYEDVLVFS